MTRSDITLDGVRSRVLVDYLKGLAIHRIVARSDQGDPGSLSYWDDEGRFHLISALGTDALVRFFVETYRPTPIVTAWNGSSGFFPGDQQAGIAAIEASEGPRFEAYREVIRVCRALLDELCISEKPKDESKLALLRRLRSAAPDEALP